MTRGTLDLCVGTIAPPEPTYSRRKIASGHVSQFRLELLGTPSNRPSAAPTDILERQQMRSVFGVLGGGRLACGARDVEIQHVAWCHPKMLLDGDVAFRRGNAGRSEEHTPELQSLRH